MKNLLIAILCTITCLSISGCGYLYDYELNAVNSFDIGYSGKLNNAFLSTYNWDGTDETTQIIIPEEYNGMPITEFGGYSGRGVPCVFNIQPTESAKEKLCDKLCNWFYMSDIPNGKIEDVKTFKFNVHVSKNIEKIEILDLGGFIGSMYIKDGTEHYNIYILLCNVTCDEENKNFYAKDGKLYYRKDNSLVTDILYYDFDIDQYMAKDTQGPIGFQPF